MLMALGQFVFQLPTLAYSELQRASAWRHAGNSRVGNRDALQFVGPGEDSITLSGALAPEVAGSLSSLAMLRAMADAGGAYAMVDGIGRVMGAWVITSLQESANVFTPDGLARRTDFTLTLLRTDDERVDSAPPGDAITTIDTGNREAAFA